jgi:predicted transcriptional regulator
MQTQEPTENISIGRAVFNDYPSIFEFLIESTHLYPEIDDWWKKKVLPGVLEGIRVIYVLKKADIIKGLFIGKKGANCKVCTLMLKDDVKKNGFGKALLLEGLSHTIDESTKDITVTVSEAAEPSVASFFESVGFRNIANVRNRYSHGVDERIYACPVSNQLTSFLLSKIHAKNDTNFQKNSSILFSLKPQFADLVINGEKRVEFRRRFSRNMDGSLAYFYISSPIKRIMFSSILSKVHYSTVNDLWERFHSIGGVSEKDYFTYFNGRDDGYAIELDNVKVLSKTLSLDSIRNRYMPSFRPPQSFYNLRHDSPLFRILET